MRGFSLPELLVVLGVTILLMGFALPSTQAMLVRSQGTAEINRLVGAVNTTRATAVQYQGTTTVCALKTNGKCGAPWNNQLSIFLDRNENARFDSGDDLIVTVQPLNTNTTVKWRSFQNRQYLQMGSNGYTRYQNGNFVICPKTGESRLARQLVINIQGRARTNHAVNGDGHPIDRRGKPLRC